MKIHEYQAKEIFKSYGIPVPKGLVIELLEDGNYRVFGEGEDKVFSSLEDAVKFVWETLGKDLVVVKAQVHAGGRGKAGGVKLAKSLDEAVEITKNMLGNKLKTYQNPEGLPINKVLIEEGVNIDREIYVGLTLDRSISRPVFMISGEGGMEIEELAQEKPDAIMKAPIDPALGLNYFLEVHKVRPIAFKLNLNKELMKKFFDLLVKIYKIYMEKDASLVEINPLVITKEGNLVCLDAKIDFDDNSLFRHPEIEKLHDPSQEDPLELEAKKWNLNYIRLNGDIGCMVNGAGLAMATMDIIKYCGGEPANFLDVGGGADAKRVAAAFKILLSDPNVKAVFVNIFGGIVRCDRVAQGIVEATKEVKPNVPIVVRLEGTNVEEGKKILKESGIENLVPAEDMLDGAQKAVRLAKGK